MKWRDVVSELDHPQFIINNKGGLRLLMQAIFRGLQDIFPIDLLYRVWKNTEGQVRQGGEGRGSGNRGRSLDTLWSGADLVG